MKLAFHDVKCCFWEMWFSYIGNVLNGFKRSPWVIFICSFWKCLILLSSERNTNYAFNMIDRI